MIRSTMVKRLFMIKKLIGKAKKKLNVKNCSDEEAAITWLTLFMISRNVLSTGMKMIGLKPVESM